MGSTQRQRGYNPQNRNRGRGRGEGWCPAPGEIYLRFAKVEFIERTNHCLRFCFHTHTRARTPTRLRRTSAPPSQPEPPPRRGRFPYRALIAPLSRPYPAPPPFVPSRLFPFLEPSRAPAPFFLPFFAFSAPFSPPPSHSILFFASHKINTLLYSAPNTGTPNEARARNS